MFRVQADRFDDEVQSVGVAVDLARYAVGHVLRQWYADGFAQDSWRVAPQTALDFGLRHEYMSALADISRNWSNVLQHDGKLLAFIGGQSGMPRGLMDPNKLRFSPRLGVARHFERPAWCFAPPTASSTRRWT